jgi:hypothetical protein
MPMHKFWRIGVVVNVDDDAPSFLEAQQWSRKLAVVKCRRNDVVRREFDKPGADMQRLVRPLGSYVVGSPRDLRRRGHERKSAGIFEQGAATDRHDFDPSIELMICPALHSLGINDLDRRYMCVKETLHHFGRHHEGGDDGKQKREIAGRRVHKFEPPANSRQKG